MRKRNQSSNSRYQVTPAGFDNMGAVLSQLGEGFEYQDISYSHIQSGGLADCEVLFTNCSGEATSQASSVASKIRDFVKRGGALYASDFAGAIVQSAFSGMVTFDQSGSSQSMPCRVVDEGLQEFLGPRIDIHFDLGGWWRVTKVKKEVQVYLASESDNKPIIVGFNYGEGYVIYTAFHNKAQTSDKEKLLLKYLVLRPVLAQAAASAQKIVYGEAFTPGKEILATINRGQTSNPYPYDNQGSYNLLYILHWTDPGKLRLIVRDPGGQVVQQKEGVEPPLQCEITTPVAGKWSCTVEAVDVPHDNFAYVLALATRQSGGSPPPPPKPAQAQVQAPAGPWPCYVLIDCSEAAYDAGQAITSGVVKFVRQLRDLPNKTAEIQVSLNAYNSRSAQIAAPRPISQLGSLSLASQGDVVLAPSLQNLLNLVESDYAATQRKALVFVVLANEPEWETQNVVPRLQAMIQDKKLNAIAIGVSDQVTDTMLMQLATIPLRVHDLNQVEAGFGWAAQVVGIILDSLSSRGTGQRINLPSLPNGIEWIK